MSPQPPASSSLLPTRASRPGPRQISPARRSHSFPRLWSHGRSSVGAKTVKPRTRPDGSVFVTNEGYHILDCAFGQIADPAALARKLSDMPGIVGTDYSSPWPMSFCWRMQMACKNFGGNRDSAKRRGSKRPIQICFSWRDSYQLRLPHHFASLRKGGHFPPPSPPCHSESFVASARTCVGIRFKFFFLA